MFFYNIFISLFGEKKNKRNLHGNKIQQLPYGLFDNMNSLRMLRLDSNLLECDCSVMWLMKHLQGARNYLNASASCKSPRAMEGKNLLDMTQDELHCSELLLSSSLFMSFYGKLNINFSTRTFLLFFFHTCVIAIIEKPEILQDPSDVEVVFGENAIFKCVAQGEPLPEIKWMLNSNEIISNNDARIHISSDGTLEIDRIDERDQGVYIC
jgi:hypothetical protein